MTNGMKMLQFHEQTFVWQTLITTTPKSHGTGLFTRVSVKPVIIVACFLSNNTFFPKKPTCSIPTGISTSIFQSLLCILKLRASIGPNKHF